MHTGPVFIGVHGSSVSPLQTCWEGSPSGCPLLGSQGTKPKEAWSLPPKTPVGGGGSMVNN